MEQGSQKNRYGTIETVDVDLLIGPMIQGPPTADITIFHFLKDLLNMKLTPVSYNDPIIIPFVSVGDENVFAHIGIRELFDDVMVNGIFSLRNIIIILVHRIGNNTLHVLSAQNGLTLLSDRGDRRAFASCDQSPGSILQSLTQGAQCRHDLGEVIVQGETLGLKEIGIIRNDERSLLAVDVPAHTEAFRLFSPEGLTRNPARILI